MFVGAWLFQTNIQAIRPRNWAMVQTITDAYMSGELALAESVEFEDIATEFPEEPNQIEINVLVGTVPPDIQINGTVIRTSTPSNNNLTETGTINTNPAQVESFILKSYLTYNIAGRSYVKSRTTVRTR